MRTGRPRSRFTCLVEGCEAAPLPTRSRCRDHHNEYNRAYMAAHPDIAHRKWTAEHAKHRDRERARFKVYWAAHRDQRLANSRRAKYGIEGDWYRDQLVGQAGRCLICGRVMGPRQDTHIDHDHATGKVRGLLCGRCNKVLGFAGDDPAILTGAVRYLSLFTADREATA